MKIVPSFIYEKQIWKRGYRYIAGIDEVGRGCFAGPVVAAAVAFAPITNFKLPISNQIEKPNDKIQKGKGIRINDSKKLTKIQREIAAAWIKENALAWGIGEVSAACINRVGIVPATEMAFRKAIKAANERLHGKGTIDYLLIDAFYIPHVRGLRRKNQKAIIKGDSKSISIAAASIIAKVHRDHLMEKLGSRPRYKRYDWVSNKGYGTKKHLEAICVHGVNGYHRQQFVQSYLEKII